MFCAMVLLLLNARELSMSKKNGNDIIQEISQREMRISYEAAIKEEILEIKALFEDQSLDAGKIREVKQDLLGMRVPAEYRDLHIKIVQALDKLEQYITDGKEAEKSESEKMMEELALRYKWIREN